MSSTGRRLRESNEEISKYISQLREQRNDLGVLVDKQKIEKSHLEAEMARIAYKLSLINKSLSQRLRALVVYDETLAHIESKYKGLVDSTLVLLSQVRKESTNLESTIDKKIGTENDCPECPKCDDYKAAVISCNKMQVNPREMPIKFIDNEKRLSRIDHNLSPVRSARASTDTEQILYTRAMEYPMLLSPMMEKEHHEKLMTEMHGKANQFQRSTRTHSQYSNRNSRVEGNFPEAVANLIAVESNKSSSTKVSETNNSEPKSQPVSSSDVDSPDMEPNREVLEERNTIIEESSSQGESPDNIKKHPAPSPIDHSDASHIFEKTTGDITKDARESKDSRKHGSHNENPNDSNINNNAGESNVDSTKDNTSGVSSAIDSTHKNHSGVEVFRLGYKSQHEKTEEPYDLNRHKRSIYNKKDFSFTIKK